MLGWAIDDGPQRLWEPRFGPMPAELNEALLDPRVHKHAFNAAFERLITQHVLRLTVPMEVWRCTMVEAYYLGFAGTLDQILEAVGLPSKDPRGHRLIHVFSKPAPKNHKADRYDWDSKPGEWLEFCQYCLQDVHVERQLYKFIHNYPTMSQWDWDRYCMDQRINDRGVPMNIDMAYGAVEMWEEERGRLTQQLVDLTQLQKVTRDPFKQWLEDNNSPTGDLRKDTLEAMHKDPLTLPHVKQALGLWMQKEAKAVSKYTSVIKGTDTDGRARGMFQFKGASRTDRTSGRRIQLQNLKRSVLDDEWITPTVQHIENKNSNMVQLVTGQSVSDALGTSIRHVIQASEGKTLAVADLTSIESVVLGWLAQCDLIDDTFRSGRDSYRVFASQYYGVHYEEVTKAMRSFSKPPVLGAGYMLGWRGLIAYAEGYGVDMNEQEAKRAVQTFRTMYAEIPRFWDWIDKAVKQCIITHRPVDGYRLHIERDADFLRIWLPSGRALSYYKPEVRQRPAPWDPEKMLDNVCYMGKDDLTTRWIRIYAHAGLFTENIVQSMAMDILMNGMALAEQDGLSIVLQVHDEIGCEEPEELAPQRLQTLIECMTTQPSWCPDMWLGADGYISKHYRKD